MLEDKLGGTVGGPSSYATLNDANKQLVNRAIIHLICLRSISARANTNINDYDGAHRNAGVAVVANAAFQN